MIQHEHYEQVNLFRWAAMLTPTHPELGLIFAIPNGGHRHIITAKKLKAEGVKSGVPDIFLAYPRQGSQWPNSGAAHGLFIELKKENGGRLSEHQSEWIMKLNNAGYKCAVCHGWVHAAQEICDYLGIDRSSVGVK